MNQIFNNLVTQNFINFKNSFNYSKEVFWDTTKERLVHAGEFGIYRENLAQDICTWKIWRLASCYFKPRKFSGFGKFINMVTENIKFVKK